MSLKTIILFTLQFFIFLSPCWAKDHVMKWWCEPKYQDKGGTPIRFYVSENPAAIAMINISSPDDTIENGLRVGSYHKTLMTPSFTRRDGKAITYLTSSDSIYIWDTTKKESEATVKYGSYIEERLKCIRDVVVPDLQALRKDMIGSVEVKKKPDSPTPKKPGYK